ncbi:conserved hypothetical protein [Alkaliphilus metalliredigens QYMF]|uniref:DUF370 domain-containing protein n=1 Tax=Alkaliphilus metalliredigens (strain QYMF) TaxID=293826 RepID=A6TJ80_ALKMQ|nr:extracellular matrix/biofilm biosynthesis regulator RemA family protein [Alkaliphilus metalliredigens]ABR46248.1 conserved hypothetical protein [Alkaliphilus metalliredigens QYMF]
MFLHLGGEIAVHSSEVIAILDIESTLKSKDSKAFLKICKEKGFIHKITNEEPRSFVITEKQEHLAKSGNRIRKLVIYYSPISAPTLQKRAAFIPE